MTGAMRALALVPLALLLPSTMEGGEVGAVPAKGKSPPACGAKILPLVTGNTWTYEAVASRDPILPELQRLAPRQPRKIVVTVKSVAPKGTETVASLEEKMEFEIIPENKEKKKPAVISEVTVNSTITCSKTKFDISPDSFFFAGEPGGFRGLELDKIERTKDTSLKLVGGTIGDEPWREDIVAHFIRKPAIGEAKLSAGKLELERAFTPAQPEDVMTRTGDRFTKAEKLQLITTGRITLDEPVSPNPQTSELPKNWRNLIWLVPDLGVVQTLNMYAHQYQLVDAKLK
jgi:hypothetical protein